MAYPSAQTRSFIGNAFDHERRLINGAGGITMWDKQELNQLLSLYGRFVAGGLWRDYAIDGHKDFAAFSVFQKSCDVPLYRIEKTPALRRKQGMYALINAHGLVLKRGRELAGVLHYFNKKPRQTFHLAGFMA